MKIICGVCGKEFEEENPIINLCDKCAEKGTKALQELHNEKGKYCNFKYTCPRSIFMVSSSHIIDK